MVALRRDDLNWTQAELARRMGTSPSVVSRLESGQHRVSVTTLDRLVRALGGVIDIRFDPLPPAVPAPTEAAAIITG
ncbi:MAG: helix-turn-helix domain-containing protein [Solirubrobacteraceae bacterium]